MLISKTDIYQFNSAHRLYNDNWNNSKNYKVFGKCSLPNFHGHNYTLEVTVKGNIDINKGKLIDNTIVNKIVNDEIIKYFDYKNLNTDIVQFFNTIPTTENLAIVIWEILRNKII